MLELQRELKEQSTLNAALQEKSPTFAVSVVGSTLVKTENGLPIKHKGLTKWLSYNQLPYYLKNTLTTSSINDGIIILTVTETTVAYMMRDESGWWEVDLTGWECKDRGSFLTNGMVVYQKTFEKGVYHVSNSSAMYLFESVFDSKSH